MQLAEFLPLLGWTAAGAFLWMCLAWLTYRISDDASWVDTFWGAGIGLVALWWAWVGPRSTASLVISAIMAIWSVRITIYLALRTWRGPEDGRYQVIRARWADGLHTKLFWFYQLQAALVVLLAAPAALVAATSAPVGAFWVSSGCVVFLLGIVTETLADKQLRAFRVNPANKGQVCDHGLWKFSRHPNYFGEILVWVSFALLATGVPWGWLAWIAPALIAHFLLNVTGIPQTEAQALRSRGATYAEYQRRTSVLVPWFPKPPAPAGLAAVESI